MKPIWILVMVIGAAAAGGAGGFIATTLAGPSEPRAPRMAEAVASNLPDPAFDTSRQLEESVASLRSDFNRMLHRLENLESGSDSPDLNNSMAALDKRIAELEQKPAVVAGDGGATPDSNYVRTAIEAVIEEREAAERAEQQATRERAMAENRERQKTAIVERLVDSLTLTTAQQAKVELVVVDYLEKRANVWSRAMEARRNGTEFDWRAENSAVDQAAQTTIRAELLGGQLQTFNELVGDNGLSSLAPGGGWGGGRFRGAANRDGNRRNNNSD